jgi:hypothetical protein
MTKLLMSYMLGAVMLALLHPAEAQQQAAMVAASTFPETYRKPPR